MAQASYTTPRITAQTRKRAYELLAVFLQHLPSFGIDLVSIVRNPDNSVTVTLTGPLPADQHDHLGVTPA